MAGIAGMVYIFGIVLAVVVVWVVVHRKAPATGIRRPAEVIALLHAARRRALVSVLFAVTVFAALGVAGVTYPALLGLPLGLAPSLAGAAGLLLYAATPPRVSAVRTDAVREASLAPRSPWMYLSRPLGIAGVATTIALVGFLIFTGMTGSTDPEAAGRSIVFVGEGIVSSAGPYPGWFYGVPALIGIAALVLATAVALRRISSTPALPDRAHAAMDELWRRRSAGAIAGISLSSLLLTFGGMALTAGISIRNATIDDVTPIGWDILGQTAFVGGFLLMIVSIVVITLSALRAASLADVAGAARGTRAAETAAA